MAAPCCLRAARCACNSLVRIASVKMVCSCILVKSSTCNSNLSNCALTLDRCCNILVLCDDEDDAESQLFASSSLAFLLLLDLLLDDDDDSGTRGGPRLVEINCRQHNMDFLPIVMACIGYNALDMALVAFLGSDEDWSEYPDMPELRNHGSMVHLVNYARGRLKKCHHLREIADLSSVFDSEVYESFLTPGSEIDPTIDIRSDAGWVQLINPDPDTLRRDYEQIVDWMPTMFETFEDSNE